MFSSVHTVSVIGALSEVTLMDESLVGKLEEDCIVAHEVWSALDARNRCGTRRAQNKVAIGWQFGIAAYSHETLSALEHGGPGVSNEGGITPKFGRSLFLQ